jgi:TfoX/Sxy family transcriptional regulator of competence genes
MTDDRWQTLASAAEGGPVTRGTMFGSKGLRTGKKFFAIWWHEQLVVKLPAERLQQLVAAGEGEPFEPMPGRAMNSWLVVGPSVDWSTLADEARAHVEAQQG